MHELHNGVCFSILATALSEDIVNHIVIPMLPFMIEFYEKDNYNGKVPEKIISSYSGYLDAAYRFSQFFSSIYM